MVPAPATSLKVLVATLALATFPSLPVVAAEPPTEAASVIGADRNAELLEFERQVLVESYLNDKRRTKRWDEEAVAFLEEAARYYVGVDRTMSYDELITAGETLIKAGCHDHFVRGVYGALALGRADHPRAESAADSAVFFLPHSEHHPLVLARAAVALAKVQADKKHEFAARTWDKAADAYLKAMREPEMSPARQRWLFSKIRHAIDSALPPEVATKLIADATEDGQVPPWLAQTLAGHLHIRLAWDARGNGYASTVTDEGWRKFALHLGTARRHLEAAYALLPQNPEAATAMITVAMGGHAAEGEDEWFWFERVVAAQLDWFPAYTRMIGALRPRWGGSYAEMIEFGYQCAATRRFDTEIPAYIVTAVARAADDLAAHDTLWRTPGLYEEIARVLTATAEHPNHADDADYYRSVHAAVAWRAGRFEDARRIIDELGDRFVIPVQDIVRGHTRDIWYDSRLYASPLAQLIQDAEAAVLRNDHARSLELLEQAVAQCPQDDEALLAAALDRRMTTQWRKGFASGEWTPLTLHAGMPGWRAIAGMWRRQDDTTVTATPNADGLKVFAAANFGTRFEFSAEVDLSQAEPRGQGNAALLFDYEHRDDAAGWRTLMADLSRAGGSYGYRWRASRRVRVPRISPSVRLHVQVWDDHGVGRVNDTVIFAGKLPGSASWARGNLIGLGGDYGSPLGTLTFKNPQIRRLDQLPAELREDEPASPSPAPAQDLPGPGEALPADSDRPPIEDH